MALTLSIRHRTRPLHGERANGDGVWVREDRGVSCFGLVDGTGHGPEAALVAARALAFLEGAIDLRAADPITGLFQGLHDHLRGTRGAAATVCTFQGGLLRGAGVGNVDVRVIGTTASTLLTPGMLGHRMLRLRPFEARLREGDRVLLWSDGIGTRALMDALRTGRVGPPCDALFEQTARTTDDATLLVADVVREAADHRAEERRDR